MSRMPCSITDGPESEDDSHFHEEPEPEYDKYLHSEPEDLNATLRSIARSGSDIEALTKGLQGSLICKRQAE